MHLCTTCNNRTVEGKRQWCNQPYASVRITIPEGTVMEKCKNFIEAKPTSNKIRK